MFSFAMKSVLASDSDKFKIILTLRRVQKFADTGPYTNFDFFCITHKCLSFFCNYIAKIYCPTFGDARHNWVKQMKQSVPVWSMYFF